MERGRHRLPALAPCCRRSATGRSHNAAGREVRHPALGVQRKARKDGLPFSFVSCLRVVGCSPLSPIAYCGRVDAEEVREHPPRPEGLARCHARALPDWVCDAVVHNPEWVEARLAKNPSGSTSKSSGWRCRATCLPDAIFHFSRACRQREKAPPLRSRHDHFQKDVLCLMAIFVAYGIVGRLDYEDAVGLEQIQGTACADCLMATPPDREALARINDLPFDPSTRRTDGARPTTAALRAARAVRRPPCTPKRASVHDAPVPADRPGAGRHRVPGQGSRVLTGRAGRTFVIAGADWLPTGCIGIRSV